MYYVMHKNTFRIFLSDNRKELLQAIDDKKKCIDLMHKCGDDYLEPHLESYLKINGLWKAISTNYKNYLYKDDSSKAITKGLTGKICIKEAEFSKFTMAMEKEFLSFLLEEQSVMWSAISHCITAPSLREKNKSVKEACEEFTEEHSENYAEVKVR